MRHLFFREYQKGTYNIQVSRYPSIYKRYLSLVFTLISWFSASKMRISVINPSLTHKGHDRTALCLANRRSNEWPSCSGTRTNWRNAASRTHGLHWSSGPWPGRDLRKPEIWRCRKCCQRLRLRNRSCRERRSPGIRPKCPDNAVVAHVALPRFKWVTATLVTV